MAYNVLRGDLDVDREDQHPGYAVGGTIVTKRLGMDELGAPGNATAPFHWHHAVEEALLVLDGRPTLRTPEGEQVLEPGDMVSFPRGPEGAHKVTNETAELARYLIFSSRSPTDIVGVSGLRKGRVRITRSRVSHAAGRGEPRLLGRRVTRPSSEGRPLRA